MTTAYGLGIAQSMNLGYNLGAKSGIDGGGASSPSGKYWVGGSATWDSTAGSKWSLTSGGAGGAAVPTSSDDVYIDAASGAVTVTRTGAGTCKSLICTGFTGTLAGTGTTTISGSLAWSATMTRTLSGAITFNSTTAGNTITLAGKGIAAVVFNGVGGSWLPQDTFASTSTVTTTNGTFNTNNQLISGTTFSKAGGASLVLGSSTINITTWTATAGAGTITAGTSVINCSGTSFAGATYTYNTVNWTNDTTTNVAVTGAATFDSISRTNASAYAGISFASNITVNTAINFSGANNSTGRLLVTTGSSTMAPITITFNGTPTLVNVDIQGIVASGSGTPWAGTSIGDCGGNTNITATSPVTRYLIAGGTIVSFGGNFWSTSSGGSVGAAMPLVQDTVEMDGNSFTAGGGLAVGGFRVPTLDFTNATNNPTFDVSTTGTIYYGDLKLKSGMSMTGNVIARFQGYGITQNIDMASVTYTGSINSSIRNSGTLAVTSALSAVDITITQGTFSQGASQVTTGTLVCLAGTTWTKSGDLVLTGTGGAVLDLGTVNVTDSGGAIKFTNVSAANKGFSAANKTFNNLWIATGGSTGVVLMQSAGNTFNDIKIDPGATLFMQPAATSINFNTFTANGTLGNLAKLDGSVNNFTSTSGTPVACTFMSITNSHASGATFAATSSTDGGGNTGWVITP